MGSSLDQLWTDFGPISDQIWIDFGKILDWFRIKFGSILARFWIEFGTIHGSSVCCSTRVWKNPPLKRVTLDKHDLLDGV